MHIRNRNFSRRNKKIVIRELKSVFLKLRKLSGVFQRLFVDVIIAVGRLQDQVARVCVVFQDPLYVGEFPILMTVARQIAVGCEDFCYFFITPAAEVQRENFADGFGFARLDFKFAVHISV